LGDRVGKNRSTVTNYLRLLKLPEEIQISLRDGQITMGHARALLAIEDKERQLHILDEIIDYDLSVRQVEEKVKEDGSGEREKITRSDQQETQNPKLDNFSIWQQKLSGILDRKISIKVKNNGKGQIVIPFTSEEELRQLAMRFEK
jgi:ParB family chromosome partitioning protein